MKSRILRAGAVLLVAGTMLGGCVYQQPYPGYYGPGPAPAAVYVGGGWGWGWGHWGWGRGCCWRR